MSASVEKPIRILLVDDHAVVRAGLCLLLDSRPTMQIVGEASNRKEALALAAYEQPDVILLDLMLGDDNALAFLPELFAAAERARVIVLTGVSDAQAQRRAVASGVMGIVSKDQAPETVIRAIERVHAGEVWIERSLMAEVLDTLAHPNRLATTESAKIATLSERERKIIALLGEGHRNPHIAERLCISEATLRHHITAIYSKLDIADRLDLVLYAYRHGLAKPPRYLG